MYLKDIKWNGKSVLELGITTGMKADDLICSLVSFIVAYKKAFAFGCLDTKALGLDSCDLSKLDPAGALCTVLNKLSSTDASLYKGLADLTKIVNGLNTSVSSSLQADKYVGFDKDDTIPGYLADKLKSAQSGTLNKKTDNKIGSYYEMTGFIPLGGQISIDPARIVDFDASGKGKINTDVAIFAICNGQNGTKNKLGRFPRWAADITKAGAIGGAATFKVKLTNIEAFDLDVNLETDQYQSTGSDIPSLTQIDIPTNVDNDGFSFRPIGESVQVARISGTGGSFNFEHKHKVTGKIKHEPNPLNIQAIEMLPLYIDELPIQRIL